MSHRFPKINFDSDRWSIRTLYQTEQPDFIFTEILLELAAKDISYHDAMRCLAAEMVIAGKPKGIPSAIRHYRRLANASHKPLYDLTLQDLRQIESDWLCNVRANPAAAVPVGSDLTLLDASVRQFTAKGVLPRLGFYLRSDIKKEIVKIQMDHRAKRMLGKGDLLNRKMEAFNDAFNAMVDNTHRNGKPILNAGDRLAICTTALALCAPSRINEVMCMSIDDYVTVNDYAQKPAGELDTLHSAHQMLIVTMKGSKGAQWSSKPVLNFLIDVFHYCMDIIKEQGKRSRMLVEWYQKNPNTLYLPPELEHWRGQPISARMFKAVVHLSDKPLEGGCDYFNKLRDRSFKGPNPIPRKDGRRNARTTASFVTWGIAEEFLLKKVHKAMANCRKVTHGNHYEGDLAKMLFLFDRDELPFIPYAANRQSVSLRLYRPCGARVISVFQKLNITIPVDGKVQFADLTTHDPRRWLTTMAETYGENLSDVLINKWANRCNLSHLKNYDLRTAETMAAQSAMPEAEKLNELTDMSNGLATMETLEDQFGLQTAIVTAHDAGIAMTSMEAVAEAIENRPVARSSRGIIIIYPQRFGVCFHQHHEKPCRNYRNDLSVSCLTCNEAAVTKGHLPTNEEVRKTAALLFSSVIRHLEHLALTHNRNIADDPAALGEHMLTLIEKGLSKDTLEQFAVHLIEEVHQINGLLKDRLLARRLEQAFVARGFVKRLDDPEVRSGALMKYHNPTQHAEPLLERALEEHGGREQVARDEQALIAKYPRFAPKAMGLTDERHLIAPDDDESED